MKANEVKVKGNRVELHRPDQEPQVLRVKPPRPRRIVSGVRITPRLPRLR